MQDIFSKQLQNFRNTTIVLKCSDSDQDRVFLSVLIDLVPNCLQRLSARMTKVATSKERVRVLVEKLKRCLRVCSNLLK